MDPTTTTAIAVLAATPAGQEVIKKALGPTAEYLGNGIKSLASIGVDNVRRILGHMVRRLGPKVNHEGGIPPRLLKEVLVDGSFTSDELHAEYFGGVLASSRSESGRDDRGAYYLQILRGLSSYQIRVHYLAYASVQNVFRGDGKRLSDAQQCSSCRIFIPEPGLSAFMDFSEKENAHGIFGHVLLGLHRDGLIGGAYALGSLEMVRPFAGNAQGPGMVLVPTGLGASLFLWAMGQGELPLDGFFSEEALPKIETPLPDLPLALRANA